MEGLEISEVKFNYLRTSNNVFRFDSSFYLKEFLQDENKILSFEHQKLKLLSENILSFGAYSLNNFVEYKDKGIPFIRGVNLKNGVVDFSDMIYIDEKAHKLLWKSEVKRNTVLLSMSGTLGDVAVATEKWHYPINSNQDIAKIHFENKELAVYVYVFLLSRYGQNYIKREARGSVQQHVFLSQIEQFEIPIFSDFFVNNLNSIIDNSENYLLESQQTYTLAEEILLEELGLKDFEPSNEPVNIKSFKESFLTTGRLDAEYYQKRYEDIEREIKKNNYSTFDKEIVKLDTGEYSQEYLKKGEKKDLTFYIRSTNIKGGIIEIDNSFFVRKSLFTRIARKGDIVTARVGSVGVFGEIRADLDGAVYSDNVLCFRLPHNYIPSVYTLLFNTKFYFELIDRLARGSVQQRLNQETLRELIIPKIDYAKQQEIAELVEQSFALKKQSENLLEVAKRAVEIAIEESEEIGIEFIKKRKKL